MKKIVFLGLVGCAAAAFLLTACGGGSGGACTDICAKVGECGGSEAQQGCQDECPDVAGLFRPDAWTAAKACILDTPCATLDPEACMFAGVTSIPDTVLDPMFTKVCTKMHECDSQVVVEDCKADMLEIEETKMIKVFNDATLTCVGNCLAAKDCTALQDLDTAGAECSCGCGIVMWCE